LVTTRDRPDELLLSLERLGEQTYQNVEVLVVDDGSKIRNDRLEELFPDLGYTYSAHSRGHIKVRNELMTLASGKYFVHLDDDANWVRPDALALAIETMEATPNAGALAFQVHEGLESPIATAPERCLEEVRSFVGCGHIIRRSAFEAFGPLKEAFGFYCEEIDFCLKLWDAGYSTIRDRGLVVHHRVNWQLRDTITRTNEAGFQGHLAKDRRVRLATRNELWWITERVPAVLMPVWLLNKIVKLMLFHAKRGFLGAVGKGVGDWLRMLPSLLRQRRPVRLRTFRRWVRLPA
jgi:GT2 family glycosyltransferase